MKPNGTDTRHWDSKEPLATPNWTLIGPTFTDCTPSARQFSIVRWRPQCAQLINLRVRLYDQLFVNEPANYYSFAYSALACL